jgi:hypothetical protein
MAAVGTGVLTEADEAGKSLRRSTGVDMAGNEIYFLDL